MSKSFRIALWVVVVVLAAISAGLFRTSSAEASAAAAEPGPSPSRWIAIFAPSFESELRQNGVAIWHRDPEFLITGATAPDLNSLSERGIGPASTLPDEGQWLYLLSHSDRLVAPSRNGAAVHHLSASVDLFLFPAEQPVNLPPVKPYGAFAAVPRRSLPAVVPHDADRDPAPQRITAVNPLVSQIVNATSQASWFQDVKDLSGENPVTIGGTSYTIRTRYADAMFPVPAANAYATEYLLDRAAAWGYTGVRESFTSAQSGCSQTKTWQNVIFTLPGQVDFGQHQQVIYVTHYDTISYTTAESNNYAPGADDAISGGSALLEALRTFKDYAFKNTIKIIFFSGEEEGLCGSIAYTVQHPAADMWRVVNMDQTAFDGNGDKKMDVYNWSLASSPGSVALGDSFVQANSDYGPIIPPANIIRDTTKMCQTDHCPFWNVGVAAIAVTEDLHNNDICPCFDQGQSSTCHDTVTQIYNSKLMFDQNYSWPSEKAAIATVASLAEPLYGCVPFGAGPAASAGNNSVHLSWGLIPSVTSYVIERAASCSGPFTAISSTAGTSFDDTSVTNGTSYAYRVRICPTVTSVCVTVTPLAGPSVIYQQGSATVTADSGDHDLSPDNCELVTVRVNLVNDGNAILTNVRLVTVVSSHPGVEVVSALPQTTASLGVGATAPLSFKFYLGRNGFPATCGEALPFTVTTRSNEAPLASRPFVLIAERDSFTGTLTYGFESDLSGWSVNAGTFNRIAGGAPGSTAGSMQSENVINACDSILSPVIVPSATSSMTMYVAYTIEAGNFDRAVVRAVNVSTGVKTLLVPTGAPYTTTGSASGLCDGLGALQGWSGSGASWRLATFSLAAFAGQSIQIEVRYSSDGSLQGTFGFEFDLVSVTNATQLVCDAGSNACAALPPEVSPPASPVPFTARKSGGTALLRFSESSGALTYSVYPGSIGSLRQGLYDHASAAGLCGFTDGATGDGQVTASPSLAAIPDNSYLLVVSRSGAGESVYGTQTGGQPIPVALSGCP